MIAILHSSTGFVLSPNNCFNDVMRVRRGADQQLLIWTLGLDEVCSYSLWDRTITLRPYYGLTNNNGG